MIVRCCHYQLVALLVLAAVVVTVVSGSSATDWRIVFYTGEDAWSGTDAPIYLELVGERGNSPIIWFKPRKSQLESGGVDVFSTDVMTDRHIGRLKSLIIGKQHTYAFFNDWQIDRIEVIDPYDTKWVFKCGCWLTRANYKKMIELTSTESMLVDQHSPSTSKKMFSSHNSRAFPLTVFLLFLLLLLVLFSYFGNSICQKWRDHALVLGGGGESTLSTSSSQRRSNRHNRGHHDHTTLPLSQGLVVTNIDGVHAVATIEDKPPEYKVLFPQTDQAAAVTTTNDSTSTTTNHQSQSSSEQPQQHEQEQHDQTAEPKLLTQTSV